MPRRTSKKATLPRVCVSTLASELLTATLLPPSLLLLLSPPVSHPHTLTPSLPYTRTHVLPQSKSPSKHSYVLPPHPHTLTLCIISLAPSHLIRIYPLPSHPHTLTLLSTLPHTLTPSHPHTIISHTSTHCHTLVYTPPPTPSHPHTLTLSYHTHPQRHTLVCTTPSHTLTPSPPHTLTGTSSSCPASTWAPLGLTSSVWSCSWITSPDSWEGKRWVWSDKRMNPLKG